MRNALIVLFIYLSSVISLGAENRVPVPSLVEQTEALSILKDTFSKELKSRDRKVLMELAQTFREQASAQDTADVSRYVLLHQASLLSAESVDISSVIKDINEIGKRFAINTNELVMESLERSTKAAKKYTEFLPIAETYLGIAQNSIEVDDFKLANEALKGADSTARKSRDKALKATISDLKRELTLLTKKYKEYQSGLELLKNNQDDPKANDKVAYYLCYIKHDWEKGVAYLANGSDKRLSTIALEELNKPTDAVDLEKLANSYLECVDKKKRDKLVASSLLARSRYYYESALPLIAGIKKMKIEKALGEISKLESKYGSKVSRKIITKGLVLHAGFDSSGKMAIGAGDKVVNLKMSGTVALARGKYKSAAEFSKDAYLVTGQPIKGISPKHAVTISIWFKFAKGGILMSELGTQSPNGGYHCSIFEVGDDGRCVARLWELRFIELGKAKPGQWNHALLRYDSETKQFDGFLNGRMTKGGTREREGAPSLHYGFGAHDRTHILSTKGFTGLLDDVLVYNRALSDSEVKQLSK